VPVVDPLSLYEILRLAKDLGVVTCRDLLQRLSLKYNETDFYVGLLLASGMLKPGAQIKKLGFGIEESGIFSPKTVDAEYSITRRGKKYIQKMKKLENMLPKFSEQAVRVRD
jgi:hypothetical protein